MYILQIIIKEKKIIFYYHLAHTHNSTTTRNIVVHRCLSHIHSTNSTASTFLINNGKYICKSYTQQKKKRSKAFRE